MQNLFLHEVAKENNKVARYNCTGLYHFQSLQLQ